MSVITCTMEKLSRQELVQEYGAEKVEWAEEFMSENDYRDELDRNYP